MSSPDRFDRLKRQLQLTILALGGTAAVAHWVLLGSGQNLDPVDRLVVPLGGALCVILALAVWRWPQAWRYVVVIVYFVYSLILLVKFIYSLFFSQNDLAQELGLYGPWFVVNYFGPFLVLNIRQALISSGLLYALIVVLGLIRTVPPLLDGVGERNFVALVHLYLAHAAVIAFLVVYTKLQRHYVQARTRAQVLSGLAYTDFLVGIPNRRQLYTLLEQQIRDCVERNSSAAIILFDLDHFKGLNDEHGHDFGDRALQEVTRAVQPRLRASDWFGRWGGEEFLIIAGDTEPAQAYHIAERLRQALEGLTVGGITRITASFGVAPYHPGDSLASWVKRADEALYKAKQAGRNRVRAVS